MNEKRKGGRPTVEQKAQIIIDRNIAIKLVASGLNNREIADFFKRSPSYVTRLLKPKVEDKLKDNN